MSTPRADDKTTNNRPNHPILPSTTNEKPTLRAAIMAFFKTLVEEVPIVCYFFRWFFNYRDTLERLEQSERDEIVEGTVTNLLMEPFTNPVLIAKSAIRCIERRHPGAWVELPQSWRAATVRRHNGRLELWHLVAGEPKQHLYLAIPLDEGCWLPELTDGEGWQRLCKVVSRDDLLALGNDEPPAIPPVPSPGEIRKGKTVFDPCSATLMDVPRPKS